MSRALGIRNRLLCALLRHFALEHLAVEKAAWRNPAGPPRREAANIQGALTFRNASSNGGKTPLWVDRVIRARL
jgi:hypothetical protein